MYRVYTFTSSMILELSVQRTDRTTRALSSLAVGTVVSRFGQYSQALPTEASLDQSQSTGVLAPPLLLVMNTNTPLTSFATVSTAL